MRTLLMLCVVLLTLGSPLAAQAAPRYGDLNRDGVVTAADTVALVRLLTGDSSLVDSTYRARPDTLLMVANFFPANVPGLGERTDARAPGWETPRWKMRVDANDLAALRRYLRGDQRSDRTVVGQLVPAWRLSGGLNLESGDVQYLGYRVRAMLGPGTYRVFATRRYPDTTYRSDPDPQFNTSITALGMGFLTPFWIGFANNTSPAWPATQFSSPRPVVYANSPRAEPAWSQEFAAPPADGVQGFLTWLHSGQQQPMVLPPGPGYPGCAGFPNNLGDTTTLWTNPNTNGNFSETFVVSASGGGNRIQQRFEVMGYHPRVMILMDSVSASLISDLVGRDSAIRVLNRRARVLGNAIASLVEAPFPYFPTSSWTVGRQISTRGAPIVHFITYYPLSTGRAAAAGVFVDNRLRADCNFVSMYFLTRIENTAEFIANLDVLDPVAVHEIGHLAHFANGYMTNPLFSVPVALNLTEGMANLYGFRYINRDVPLSRLWERPFAQLPLTDVNNSCSAAASQWVSDLNGIGLVYQAGCQFIVSTIATAVQRGLLSANEAWSRLDSRSNTYDKMSRAIMQMPLSDWYPQVIAATWTQGRFALRQGAPWQIPMKRPVTPADTVNTAVVAAGQQIKVRMDSTVAGRMFRIVSVPDSAIIRIFTRDSTVGATSVQLHNLALTVVRE